MGLGVERFIELNELHKNEKRRVPWDERVKMMRDEYPSIGTINWYDVMSEPPGVSLDATDEYGYQIAEPSDLMVSLLRGIFRIDQIGETRSVGVRPLDWDKGQQTRNELMGRQFCELPFYRAFKLLMKEESLAIAAGKTSISRTRVYRLVVGDAKPTADEMRSVAKAYNKKPSYFVEYRKEYILAAVAERLEDSPELVEHVYKALIRS